MRRLARRPPAGVGVGVGAEGNGRRGLKKGFGRKVLEGLGVAVHRRAAAEAGCCVSGRLSTAARTIMQHARVLPRHPAWLSTRGNVAGNALFGVADWRRMATASESSRAATIR